MILNLSCVLYYFIFTYCCVLLVFHCIDQSLYVFAYYSCVVSVSLQFMLMLILLWIVCVYFTFLYISVLIHDVFCFNIFHYNLFNIAEILYVNWCAKSLNHQYFTHLNSIKCRVHLGKLLALSIKLVYIGYGPFPVTVTTRIIPFFICHCYWEEATPKVYIHLP